MIVLFKKGTGEAARMNEFGFEALIQAGEYYFSKDAAIKAVIEEKKEEKKEEVKNVLLSRKKPGRRKGK